MKHQDEIEFNPFLSFSGRDFSKVNRKQYSLVANKFAARVCNLTCSSMAHKKSARKRITGEV